jgi:hypothetical protein
MTIHLLEGTLEVDIFYECEDKDFDDNVCIKIVESCPPEERLLRAGETYIYITAVQARELGEMLLAAVLNRNAEESS